MNAVLVNCDPWLLLKIVGLPWRAGACSSASMQNLTSGEIDTHHASTRRVNQSMMARRQTKPLAMGT